MGRGPEVVKAIEARPMQRDYFIKLLLAVYLYPGLFETISSFVVLMRLLKLVCWLQELHSPLELLPLIVADPCLQLV